MRTAEHGCCKWCNKQAGTYDYPDVPDDVYKRHANCRCSVEYDPGDGKRQDVWSKRWTNGQDYDILEQRKNTGLLSESDRRYEQDIIIGRSLGAKHKDILVELPNGEKVPLTEGSRVTQVQTIAGLGRDRQIDEIDTLLAQFPGTDERKWQKKKGFGFVDYDGESYEAELHFYEEPLVGRVKWKVKPDAAGNWFLESE